ncbi:hypothetical protein H7I93_05435, partial [Mycobacterium nebraskense]|nr:hypothetical protein [Mycobacterium nebraskense]
MNTKKERYDTMNTNKKLLILGAGIGGLSVIKELTDSGVTLDDLDI